MEKQENVRGRKGKMEKYFLLVPFCPVLSRSDGIDAAELADEITHIAESRIIGDLLQRMFRMKQIVRGLKQTFPTDEFIDRHAVFRFETAVEMATAQSASPSQFLHSERRP